MHLLARSRRPVTPPRALPLVLGLILLLTTPWSLSSLASWLELTSGESGATELQELVDAKGGLQKSLAQRPRPGRTARLIERRPRDDLPRLLSDPAPACACTAPRKPPPRPLRLLL